MRTRIGGERGQAAVEYLLATAILAVLFAAAFKTFEQIIPAFASSREGGIVKTVAAGTP
jgi:Flp pilus assembly pilin Flp